MAEIYAPERASGTSVPRRDERQTSTQAKRGTNKGAVITAVIAVAAIVILIAILAT